MMIYCVEDDDSIRELMLYALRASNYSATGLPDAGAFWQALRREKPELVLLDVMLPGEDGFEILHRLRDSRRTARIPIIMVTALSGEQERVRGLDGGADDYIAKPFTMTELTARVKALLRRCADAPAQKNNLSCGGVEMDILGHSVHVNGKKIHLTVKEFAVLRMLMENEGETLSSEAIMRQAWGYGDCAGSHTVCVHIQSVRLKLAPCGYMLENVYGRGYRIRRPGTT